MRIYGIIPARLKSTRMPRKMLALIDGKPLVWHTWNQARKAKLLDRVVVATDSEEILHTLKPYGVDVVLTPRSLKTGTDRVAEAAKKIGAKKQDIVINIQGDEPMIPPTAIDLTARLLVNDPRAVMSTVGTPIKNKSECTSPSIVKVVTDTTGYALYFSRSLVPHSRVKTTSPVIKHLGIYGFRFAFLSTFTKLSQGALERTELLEQLRALEHGYRIKVGIGSFERVEVNTPEEFRVAKSAIERMAKKRRK